MEAGIEELYAGIGDFDEDFFNRITTMEEEFNGFSEHDNDINENDVRHSEVMDTQESKEVVNKAMLKKAK